MDIELAIDVMEMAQYLDHVVLFSGDGDFRTLVDALQRQLSDSYRPICHLVFPAMDGPQMVRYLVDRIAGDAGSVQPAAASKPRRDTAADIAAFVRKMDSAGNELWTRQFGANRAVLGTTQWRASSLASPSRSRRSPSRPRC